MKVRAILTMTLLALCAGCNSADTKAKDTEDIKALEGRFEAAFQAKDVNAIIANYVADDSLIVFDAIPPLQYTGAAAYRKDWVDTFAAYPGPVEFGIANLDITVGGDVAYSRSIQHGTFTDKDGKKTELTIRVTDGYKKVDGKWLIAQEHVSVPVDLETMKADLNAK